MADPTVPGRFAVRGGYVETGENGDECAVIGVDTPVGFYDIVVEMHDGQLLVTPVEGGVPEGDEAP